MSGDLLSGLWMRRQALGRTAPQFSPEGWATLLGQARSARLTGRLALWFDANGGLEVVPEGPRSYLHSAMALARRQEQEVHWEVDQIRRALVGVDTPVVLLKGAAYLLAGLPAARGRLFSDIDILVSPGRLQAVEHALFGAGWIPTERDPYNIRYYRQWMHELPPLSHIARGTAIDVHHTITPPTSAFNVDGARLLAAIRPVDGARRLWVLQPVDMVLHSAVHLFQEGEFDRGLRDLLDMDDLLKHFAVHEPDFWPQLIARAHELGLQVALHHALFHVARLFGTRPPAAQHGAVLALRPAWLPRMLMARLLTTALRPMHPSCHRFGEGLARWLLYLRSHWLRMPLHLLVPHLARKAWMRRFPEKKPEPVAPNPAGR